jgi:hypothetical protein
LANEDFLAA